MKFFHLFQTEDEFNQAYTSDSYNEPWISFTRQTYVDGNSLIVSGATLINYQSEVEETVHSMDVVSSILTASGYTLTYNGFHIENGNGFYTFSGEPGLATTISKGGIVRNPISGNTIIYQNNVTDSVVSVQTTTVPIDGTYAYTDTITITLPFGNRMADVYTNSETGEVIFVNAETPFVDGDKPIIDNPK